MAKNHLWSWPLLAALLLVRPAQAQFDQYTPAGDFGDRRSSFLEELEDAADSALWRLGKISIQPWFSIDDVEYLDNVRAAPEGEEETDVTVTVGAGLRAYLPVGETYLVAHLLPEYVWWRESDRNNRLNGRYGAGLFGNVGRITVEITARRDESSRYFSRQIEERVNVREDLAEVGLQLPLSGGFALSASGSWREVTYPDDQISLSSLSANERQESVTRFGIEFESQRGLTVALLTESSEADFDPDMVDRSNSGNSPALELAYDSGEVYFKTSLVERSLEPTEASVFLPYEEITGRVRSAWSPVAPFELQLFASRNLVYSADSRWAYYQDDAAGVGMRVSLGSRGSLRLFTESGRNDYTPIDSEPLRRMEDVETYGGTMRFRIGGGRLRLGWRRTSYDSNLAGLDRRTTVLRASFDLGSSLQGPWL